MSKESDHSLQKFYEYTTKLIEIESSLINSRISWLLTFQGFLFATIALLADINTEPKVRDFLNTCVPLVGAVVALFTLFGVGAAYRAIGDIKKGWEEKKAGREEEKKADREEEKKADREEEKKADRKTFPRPYGDDMAHHLGKLPSIGTPVLFLIVWVVFLLKVALGC